MVTITDIETVAQFEDNNSQQMVLLNMAPQLTPFTAISDFRNFSSVSGAGEIYIAIDDVFSNGYALNNELVIVYYPSGDESTIQVIIGPAGTPIYNEVFDIGSDIPDAYVKAVYDGSTYITLYDSNGDILAEDIAFSSFSIGYIAWIPDGIGGDDVGSATFSFTSSSTPSTSTVTSVLDTVFQSSSSIITTAYGLDTILKSLSLPITDTRNSSEFFPPNQYSAIVLYNATPVVMPFISTFDFRNLSMTYGDSVQLYICDTSIENYGLTVGLTFDGTNYWITISGFVYFPDNSTYQISENYLVGTDIPYAYIKAIYDGNKTFIFFDSNNNQILKFDISNFLTGYIFWDGGLTSPDSGSVTFTFRGFSSLNITCGLDAILALSSSPSPPISVTAGRIAIVTEAILQIIASADTTLQPQNIHVLPNWKTPVNYLIENYPVVTIRIGNEDMTEKIYGRQMSGIQRGHFVTYSFTAHVWGEKTWQLFEDIDTEDETVPRAKLASDLADKIIDTLEKFTGDSTSGIVHFNKITARESEPERGPQRLTRIIISGFVLVQRPLL